MKTRTKVAVVAAIAVVLAFAAGSSVHLALESAGGTALWNADQIYFFISTDRIGHDVNGVRFPFFLIENLLGGIEDPDDHVITLDVFQITSSGVEHHVLPGSASDPGSGPSLFTPRHGRIYANCPAIGGLCAWAIDHFEPATNEERRAFDGIMGLTKKDFDSGWSSKGFGIGPGGTSLVLTVDAGGSSGFSMRSRQTWGRTLTIDLSRDGHPPEKIWDRALRWGIVGRSEYLRTFLDEKRLNAG